MVQHGTLAQQDLSPLSKPSWEPWGTMGNHGEPWDPWQVKEWGGSFQRLEDWNFMEFQSGDSGEIFRAPPGISGDLEQGDLAVVAPASC